MHDQGHGRASVKQQKTVIMQVYIVQNEKDEICYVGIDPIDVLEEIERMGKTTLTVGIWPLGDCVTTSKDAEL